MKIIFIIYFLLIFHNHGVAKADGMSRLKDLVFIKGVRENPLIGYGLVIGLNGTGDGGGEITNTSLKKMFQRLGLNPKEELSSKNVAAVIVTTKLPPFARIGQKVDVTVSSIGEAGSLAGGTLLITPLKGGDDNIYAIASGPLSIGGLQQGANFPTSGIIPNGATIEKEILTQFDKKKSLRLSLKNPDFTTAARAERLINQQLGGKFATARDSTTIDLMIPINYQRKVVKLMAILESIKINPDQKANIVINEKTGTVVAGGNITLKPVAISHGDLSIIIQSEGQEAAPEEGKQSRLYYVEKKTTLKDLVKSLNAFGVTPEDLIPIFQTLKRNGALISDLEFL
jgi:flagellar P-ring protein precursor FlgI